MFIYTNTRSYKLEQAMTIRSTLILSYALVLTCVIFFCNLQQ